MIRKNLSDDTRDFWVFPNVRYLDKPSELEFAVFALREYQPVIIRGVTSDWISHSRWNIEYLRQSFSESKSVIVNLTPDGFADAVKITSELASTYSGEVFTYPCECKMNADVFFDMLTSPREDDAIPYLSTQNDNIRSQFPSLLTDIPSSISFAKSAFGQSEPEAINLWIGDERSISSIHKDHFENFYAVISGEKTFTLLPPTDISFLPEKEVPTYKYELSGHNEHDVLNNRDELQAERLILSRNQTPSEYLRWIPLDPDDPEAVDKYPDFKLASPIRCNVQAGEILYIPAMWYHRVSQTCLTISVNYWYDQHFNFRYVFYNLTRNLKSTEEEEEEKEALESNHVGEEQALLV